MHAATTGLSDVAATVLGATDTLADERHVVVRGATERLVEEELFAQPRASLGEEWAAAYERGCALGEDGAFALAHTNTSKHC